jgi:uncharacterized protein (DUF952 family)
MIYHITQQSAWQQALDKGEYTCESLYTEGFIHNSTQEQVKGVYGRYYQGQKDLVVLCIEESRLKTQAIFEKATNGVLYPHIYGAINLDAVVEVKELKIKDL